MKTKVQKWGNSLALRIPKALAADGNVRDGTMVELKLLDGKIVVAPVKEPHYTLRGLLAGVGKGNLHGETASGRPVGREEW